MKTYDIYAKQDGKWQRKGIQGEPTPPECGGSVEDSGLPVEVSTQEEIDALAIGTIFKYTGESGTYENGALYIVEAGE